MGGEVRSMLDNPRPRSRFLWLALLSLGCVIPARGAHEPATPAAKTVDPAQETPARLAAIKRCYEELLTRKPTAKGKLVLVWTIKTDGHTEGARIESDTVGDTTLGSCLVGLLAGWTFPAPTEPVTVSFPFFFDSKQ